MQRRALLQALRSKTGGGGNFASVRYDDFRDRSGGAAEFRGRKTVACATLVENVNGRMLRTVRAQPFAQSCHVAGTYETSGADQQGSRGQVKDLGQAWCGARWNIDEHIAISVQQVFEQRVNRRFIDSESFLE